MINEAAEHSAKYYAQGSVVCPSCGLRLKRNTRWCGNCGFTGSQTLDRFGDSPPPLSPILDVTNLWSESEEIAIHQASKNFRKEFPQIHWKVCAISPGSEPDLPLFAFWLFNASPLAAEESIAERQWSALLLINSATNEAHICTGYLLEPWLSEEMLNRALKETTKHLATNKPGKAVTAVFRSVQKSLRGSWHRTQRLLNE